MAAGKNIEIRMAVTGGQQAAAEVGKVGAAVEDLGDSAEGSVDGMEDLNQKLDDMRARAAKLKEETQDLAEQQTNTNQAMRLGRAATVGLGLGGAVLAKTFQEISKGLESIDLENLRQIAPAAAAQVNQLNALKAALENPLAALQKLISGSTIGEAFGAMNEQLALNVEQQEKWVARLTSASREMAARLGETAKELAMANAVLDAKDQADSSVRDAADAARVRAGEAPEDVRVERAAFDRDRELEKINRRLTPLASRTQEQFDLKQRAFADANRVMASPGATSDQMGKAALAAAKAASDFEQAKKEYDNALAIALEQRRGVRAKYETEVGDAAGDKAARLAREQEKADKIQEKADKKKQREQAAARRTQLQTERDREKASLSLLAGNNESRILNTPRALDNKTLQNLAQNIGNADTDAEIAALTTQITAMQKQLGTAVVNSLLKMLTEQQAIVSRLNALEANIKNTRGK